MTENALTGILVLVLAPSLGCLAALALARPAHALWGYWEGWNRDLWP